MTDIKLILRYLPIHSIVIFTILGLCIYYLSNNIKYRAGAVILWGLLFVSLYSHPYYSCLVLFMSLIIFFICKLLMRTDHTALKRFLMYSGIIFAAAGLSVFKYPQLKASLPFVESLRALGISYFTFKFIHVIIDIYRGRLKTLKLLEFLSFIFFFPTFSAGPIDRYGRFSSNLSSFAKLDKSDIDAGITRIIYGLFKKFIIADKAQLLIISMESGIAQADRLKITALIVLLSIKVYYDFSGYSDIAIGLGRLFGIKVPENFNKPYLKRNIANFWQNWHITLTSWLREYLFMPLGKSLMPVIGSNHPWILNSICQIITMSVVGIWHGSTWNFLIWGLYHGIGLSIYRIYSDLAKRYLPENIQNWLSQSKLSAALSIAVNFAFVSIGWLFFVYSWDKAVMILKMGFGR